MKAGAGASTMRAVVTEKLAITKRLSRGSKLACKGEVRRAVNTLDVPPSIPADSSTFENLTEKFSLATPEPDLTDLLKDAPAGAWSGAEWVEALGALDPSGEGNPAAALMAHVISGAFACVR